jgi:hypothetical protein
VDGSCVEHHKPQPEHLPGLVDRLERCVGRNSINTLARSAASMICRGVFFSAAPRDLHQRGWTQTSGRGALSHNTLHSATSDMPWWCAP